MSSTEEGAPAENEAGRNPVPASLCGRPSSVIVTRKEGRPRRGARTGVHRNRSDCGLADERSQHAAQ